MQDTSGRSAVRLARLLWEQEVPGSNPGAPTRCFMFTFSTAKVCSDIMRGQQKISRYALQQHNTGKSASTRAGAPWALIHSENFASRSEATQREKKIKSRGIKRYLSDLNTQPKG